MGMVIDGSEGEEVMPLGYRATNRERNSTSDLRGQVEANGERSKVQRGLVLQSLVMIDWTGRERDSIIVDVGSEAFVLDMAAKRPYHPSYAYTNRRPK